MMLPQTLSARIKCRSWGIIILSHCRADRLYTLSTLRRQGYTGDVCILIDEQDQQREEYLRRYGEAVRIFSKDDIAGRYPYIFMDTFDDIRGVVLYARQAAWDVAEELGWDVFIELDDDYTEFSWKFDADGCYLISERRIKNLQALFEILVDFYCSAPVFALSIAQTGDFVGGARGSRAKKLFWRKTMNFFVLSPRRRFDWHGRINEDVCTNLFYNRLGYLFLTVAVVELKQKQTQSVAGGMTGTYRPWGTYLKSFYPVLISPPAVRLTVMGERYRRVHHNILWTRAAAKVVSNDGRVIL
jgi:hypothetical protein